MLRNLGVTLDCAKKRILRTWRYFGVFCGILQNVHLCPLLDVTREYKSLIIYKSMAIEFCDIKSTIKYRNKGNGKRGGKGAKITLFRCYHVL